MGWLWGALWYIESMKTFALLLAACVLGGVAVGAPARHPSYEPKVPGAVGPENLFRGAKASAKDQWSDRAPGLAVNGKRDRNDHWASDSLPAWHQIDLGAPKTFSTVRVVPYWGDGRVYGFKVEGSLDGKTWAMIGDRTANSIEGGPDGFVLDLDEPMTARYVRTTFTRNTANNAGHLVEIEGYAAKLGGEPRLIPVSMRQRFGRDALSGLAAPEAPAVHLRGWRGERVAAQVLVEAPAGFKELRAEPLVLRAADGREIAARVDVVRYTLGNGKLVADILDGTSQTRFEGVTRPMVLTVDIPADAPEAAEGIFAVRVNGKRLTCAVRLRADALVLPPPSEWSAHVDLWQHPDAVARWHDVPAWSEEHFRLMKPYMERLAAMGQKTITATLIDEAWNEQTYDRFRSMVAITKKADGTWVYDYSVFDRWVTFMREEIGMRNATISCYSMLPWSLTFPYYDEALGRTVAPRLNPGTPEYEAFWGRLLEDFVRHVRAKGWENITRIAMDERPDHLFKPALAVVRKHAPSLKIVAACNAPSNITADFDDCSYGLGICERLVKLAGERRAQGKLTTFYVCCGPARPNTFMASGLAESEWLFPMAAHYGLDGMLRWTFQSWVENPLVCQDYVTWPSGDTSLIYPGNRPSLRWEGLRNGIETFEKVRILRETAKAKGKPEAIVPVEEALKAFTVARGMKAGNPYEADLQALDAALEQATEALR